MADQYITDILADKGKKIPYVSVQPRSNPD